MLYSPVIGRYVLKIFKYFMTLYTILAKPNSALSTPIGKNIRAEKQFRQ